MAISFVAGPPSAAQAPASTPPVASPALAPEAVARHEQLRQLLAGARLVGAYTVCGAAPAADEPWKATELPLQADSYEIRSLEKLPAGDLWLISARIVYGGKDLTVPVPIAIQWAGSTPVITLDDVTIPGLGTYGARVVLHEGRYAGTWRHDDEGGHMFGLVRKGPPSEPDNSAQ